MVLFSSDHFAWEECGCRVACVELKMSQLTSSLSALPDLDLGDIYSSEDVMKVTARHEHSSSLRHHLFGHMRQRTESLIMLFLSTTENVTSEITNFHKNITDTIETAGLHMRAMSARVSAHLKMGLMGMKKMIENGFIDGWRMLEQRSLGRLSSELYETIVQFDRIIQQLQYTSSTENVMRKILYFSMDSQLSYKMDLTIQAVDNLTNVYYAFLNAEPLSSHLVTPSRRYDDALIPFDMLSQNTGKQQEFFNGLSQLLSGYIEQIIQLQNILKEVYHMSTLNETTYTNAKHFFSKKSVSLSFYYNMFRNKVVYKAAESIETQLVNFRKGNHSMVLAYANCHRLLTSIIQLMDEDVQHIQGEISDLARNTRSYLVGDQGLDKFIEYTSSEHVQQKMLQIHQLSSQFVSREARLNESWSQLEGAAARVWTDILEEPTLHNYYSRIHNDVTDMIENPMKSRFYTGIFLHSKMLAMTEQEVAGLHPREFMGLLNADAALYTPQQKAADVQDQMGRFRDQSCTSSTLTDAIRRQHIAYLNLKEHLHDLTVRSRVDDTFTR